MFCLLQGSYAPTVLYKSPLANDGQLKMDTYKCNRVDLFVQCVYRRATHTAWAEAIIIVSCLAVMRPWWRPARPTDSKSRSNKPLEQARLRAALLLANGKRCDARGHTRCYSKIQHCQCHSLTVHGPTDERRDLFFRYSTMLQLL